MTHATTLCMAALVVVLAAAASAQSAGNTRLSVAVSSYDPSGNRAIVMSPTHIIVVYGAEEGGPDQPAIAVTPLALGTPLPAPVYANIPLPSPEWGEVLTAAWVPATDRIFFIGGVADIHAAVCSLSDLTNTCSSVVIDADSSTISPVARPETSTVYVIYRDTDDGMFAIVVCDASGTLSCDSPVTDVLNEASYSFYNARPGLVITSAGITMLYSNDARTVVLYRVCSFAVDSCTTVSLPFTSIPEITPGYFVDVDAGLIFGSGGTPNDPTAFVCDTAGTACSEFALVAPAIVTEPESSVNFEGGFAIVTATSFHYVWGGKSGLREDELMGIISCPPSSWVNVPGADATVCDALDVINTMGLDPDDEYGASVAVAFPALGVDVPYFAITSSKKAGSTLVVGSKVPCPPGTESSISSCVPCPPGTYLAASSKCILCPPGTFSANISSTTCSPCVNPAKCIGGSSFDTSAVGLLTGALAALAEGNETESFPASRATFADTKFSDPDSSTDIVVILAFVWLSITLLLLLVFLLLVLLARRAPSSVFATAIGALAAIDIFFRVEKVPAPRPDDDDDDDDDKPLPMVLAQRRSPLGGLVTIIAVIGLIVVVAALSVRFSLDNAIVTTSQRPSRFVAPGLDVKPDLRVSFMFIGVSSDGCVASAASSSEFGTCASTLTLTSTGVSNQATVATECRVATTGACEVRVVCTTCVLVERPFFSVSLGLGSAYGQSVIVTTEIVRSALPYGTPEASGTAAVFLTTTSSARVFQAPPSDLTGSIIEYTAYQTGHFDRRSSETSPETTLGFALTEGTVATRGRETELANLIFLPPQQFTPVGIRVNPGLFHIVTEVRRVETFLTFAALLGGAVSALFGVLAAAVKSLEKAGKVVAPSTIATTGGVGAGGAALAALAASKSAKAKSKSKSKAKSKAKSKSKLSSDPAPGSGSGSNSYTFATVTDVGSEFSSSV